MSQSRKPLSSGFITVVVAALLAAVPAWAQTGASLTLRGAGATFPAPLYYKWAESFTKSRPDIRVTYDSVGSGDGISRFVAGTVDFGASDAGIGEQDAAKVARGILVVPGTAGMIALAYNMPGLGGSLRLPRDVYVDILLGKLTRWDDERLKRANPALKLPARTIAVVARLDRSGTTFAFTNHLSAISDAWRAGPGVGTAIEWPRQTMLARGNEGVASRIKISEGSIGYVEYGFASRLGLSLAEIENRAGQFVAPSEASGQSALAEAFRRPTGDELRIFITDPSAPESYPVVTFSWIMLYKQYPDERTRSALRAFLSWGLIDGQKLAKELGFLPLPAPVVARGMNALDVIR